MPGKWQTTLLGESFVVEKRYQESYLAGAIPLRGSASLEIIAAWAGDPDLAKLSLEQFVFIDTETTGLSGGTGTYTFLIGAGRFENDYFRLAQFFLRDPAEESAQLAALENFIAPCKAIVSFNGKSFDIPLLNTRFITNGWPPPMQDAGHLDLLHLARRLWKARLPSRTLGDLEVKILGMERTGQDIPGWMVPDLYFDYLHTGDARPLHSVFYHNEVDVVSMAALLNHMTTLLANPLEGDIEHGLDLIAIGKLYADLGYLGTAAKIYQRGLAYDNVHQDAYWKAIQQLSFIHKRRAEIDQAVQLWEQAAQNKEIYAHIELAKIFEHSRRKYIDAAFWTQEAIRIASKISSSSDENNRLLSELEHRLNRLNRKQKHSVEKYAKQN
ncbi:MAG: ribonuclease H-like domain-containing protein [Anaerolineae bacterium]|nr:ribonuclease H-like domain-containing protein [Anaerolineae bacterium]